ncbi:MAG: transglycosylase domain-containing protein [Candidatus Pacebacteria bacterium]|nr:transglycosylase domain-containing protein [Candidatus Paceibacterota bacterium]
MASPREYLSRMRFAFGRHAKHPYARSLHIVLITFVALTATIVLSYAAQRHLRHNYSALESVALLDRHHQVLTLLPNKKDVYAAYTDTLPARVAELLIEKEDRFFYYHPGLNPFSTSRAAWRYVTGNRIGGASTITQQLVKNLLAHEQDRSFLNKGIELLYALSLELFSTKDEILLMYANTVFMGNHIQGLSGASELYFNKPLHELDDTKIMMLVATLSSPSLQNPWEEENARVSRNLALRIGIAFDPSLATVTTVHQYAPPRNFELSSMRTACPATCQTTIDKELTQQLRALLRRHVDRGYAAGARNGAIVVIKLPENQLLAIVGTPDVYGTESGQQINMAIEPRPIGSTAKPFIYLAGFEKGLRPYTLVDDREYKFPTASGFPLYPKNYDGLYRGWVTLHTALSNSLNVPTVKTLQYIGLSDFYTFLEQRLQFLPLNPLDSYQYGIALGGLEMDPLTLAHYLTIFPAQGTLKPLQLFLSHPGGTRTIRTPMSSVSMEKKVADPALTQLVTRVLNDRYAGVEQFGLAGNLNLFQRNYAVKTGTSRDYHDSWTVGYTPDFVVAVWLGNAENEPLKQITGQSGAGAIWKDSMELLLNSPYNLKTPFSFDLTEDVFIDGSIDFGLPGDVVAEHRHALPNTGILTSPQSGDTFLWEARTTIPLVATESVSWSANGAFIGEGARVFFKPRAAGTYTITAQPEHGTPEKVTVRVVEQ